MAAKYVAFRMPGHTPLRPGGKVVFGPLALRWLKRRAKRGGYRMIVKRVHTKRDVMKAWMRWALAHEASVHYQQSRPIPLKQMKQRILPLYTDCSGSTTGCAYAAGVPDPNGRGYDGSGYTGTLRAHCPRRLLGKLQVGDLIIYGSGTGRHVVMVYEPDATNPLVFSHGQESGPRLYRHSVEVAVHGTFTCHDVGAG